jgi:tRNA threonylcarbamoyladenosine biosynthesis protein TsaE
VVLLHGALGSGKTCFVTGLARGLGVRGRVRSPSFGLIHEMHGRVLLAHVDLYRLDEREADRLGSKICASAPCSSWSGGERLPSPWQQDALSIQFRMRGPTQRELTAHGRSPRGRTLLEAWRALDASARNA